MKDHMVLCLMIRVPAGSSRDTLQRVVAATGSALAGQVRSAYLVKRPVIRTRMDAVLNALGFKVSAIEELELP